MKLIVATLLAALSGAAVAAPAPGLAAVGPGRLSGSALVRRNKAVVKQLQAVDDTEDAQFVMQSLLNLIIADLPNIVKSLPSIAQGLPSIVSGLQDVVKDLPMDVGGIKGIGDDMPTVVNNLSQLLDQAIPLLNEAMPQITQDLPNTLRDLPGILQNLPNILSNVPNLMDEALPEILKGLTGAASEVLSAATGGGDATPTTPQAEMPTGTADGNMPLISIYPSATAVSDFGDIDLSGGGQGQAQGSGGGQAQGSGGGFTGAVLGTGDGGNPTSGSIDDILSGPDTGNVLPSGVDIDNVLAGTDTVKNTPATGSLGGLGDFLSGAGGGSSPSLSDIGAILAGAGGGRTPSGEAAGATSSAHASAQSAVIHYPVPGDASANGQGGESYTNPYPVPPTSL